MISFFFIGELLLLLLAILSIVLIFSKNLFHCMILLSIFSFLITIYYCLLGAPDVAITEAAVGASMSAIFFINALKIRKNETVVQTKSYYIITITLIFAITFTLIQSSSYIIEHFALPTINTHNDVKNYYLTMTKNELQFPNIVAAILASFRGFDTMLETMVIMTAGIAIMQILNVSNKI